jgi:hypothetical protein
LKSKNLDTLGLNFSKNGANCFSKLTSQIRIVYSEPIFLMEAEHGQTAFHGILQQKRGLLGRSSLAELDGVGGKR